jgi:nitroimidazol reductase NimA-like FMN-containing flavoprotein (pyridoxamine 5'-phosphate oxidase superfamily)
LQETTTNLEITAGQAIVPDGYMRSDREHRLLDWSHVDSRMREAKNYWVATTRPNGHPHVAPTWAIWHDNSLYFDGSPETRRMRNIAANPHVAVHLEDGDHAVIVEGIVREVGRPSREFAEQLAAIYGAKYKDLGYEPGPETWDEGGLYVLEPTLALAWTEFGVDMTRWTIRRSG